MPGSYADYLASPHWQRIRAESKSAFPDGCIVSGSPIFDIHHLNYWNPGHEKFWLDIIPLAPEHHTDFHAFAIRHKLPYYDVITWAENRGFKLTDKIWSRLQDSDKYNRKLSHINRKITVKKKQKNKVDLDKQIRKRRCAPKNDFTPEERAEKLRKLTNHLKHMIRLGRRINENKMAKQYGLSIEQVFDLCRSILSCYKQRFDPKPFIPGRYR